MTSKIERVSTEREPPVSALVSTTASVGENAIARQRAAHQVLDHGSIVYDPFALKILREEERDVLQFANAHPLASIGRLFTAARSRIAEDALSRAVDKGIRQIVILGAGLDTFALGNPHGARQIRIYEVDHPAKQGWKRQRLADAQIELPPMAYLRASRVFPTLNEDRCAHVWRWAARGIAPASAALIHPQ
jgi:O-methyltransferase involved in polyketide biosynthesis